MMIKYLLPIMLIFGCKNNTPTTYIKSSDTSTLVLYWGRNTQGMDSQPKPTGDVGEIYIQDKRLRDSISDNYNIHRYADSIYRYLQIKFSQQAENETYHAADKQYQYYQSLFNTLDKKWPAPETPIPTQKDITIYPPKP